MNLHSSAWNSKFLAKTLSSIALLLLSPAGEALAQDESAVAAGAPRAPVRDEMMRPITAGGFVDGAPVVFSDATARSGLDAFLHSAGSKVKRFLMEVPSGGVALFDYDRDGWIDIYLVNGSNFEALRGQQEHPKAALYRNNGDGTFTDTTAAAGVANEGWGFGAAVGDYDNDGWPDLHVTNFGKDRLYRNNGDGSFSDVTDRAGISIPGWSTAASFGDFDRDGDLDLFVCGYLEFPPCPESTPNPPEECLRDRKAEMETAPEIRLSEKALARSFSMIPQHACSFRGKRVLCGPLGLIGIRDFLFRNNGDGTFTDVAADAGVDDPNRYYGFASTFVDVDGDRWVDLVVANDSKPNYLYRNRGDGTFEDMSYPSGFAFNQYAKAQAGMGLAVGDYDNDGQVDFYVTNFSDDHNTLYKNEGDNFFLDVTFQVGLGEATFPFLGWGTGFVDYDNDGWKDLFVANGHIYAAVDSYDWGTTYSQRPLLFRNVGGKRFQAVPPATGSGLAVVVSARGAAFGDLDNDGRVDVVLNCADGPPKVLRNETSTPEHHWLSLRLVGGEKSPRDAIGATVFVTAGGRRQRGDVISGASYSSHSDFRLHFGLGRTETVELVEIHWPSGRRQTLSDLPVDQILTIREGQEPAGPGS